ncbi:hypothetical protein B0H19DRAFT_917237 [Mycena capillaripes]|nr:hypothetical protein B0H19DRAFT_917237 [Mycena capillaripes]
MGILKLYGGPSKLLTCERRVATVLHDFKIPFELIEIDVMGGETKSPAVMKHQPFGQIPHIVRLTRAICRYLAAKHPESGRIPTDPKAHVLFKQAASVEAMTFDPPASKMWRKLSRPYVTTCPSLRLDACDVILSKQRYLAGDTLTLANLFHIFHTSLVGIGGSDIMTRKPNVARYAN